MSGKDWIAVIVAAPFIALGVIALLAWLLHPAVADVFPEVTDPDGDLGAYRPTKGSNDD